MKIQLSDLRRATDALFDYLERTGRTEIDLTEDFYWSIPEKRLYSVYSPPPESELTMGQLSDDWNEVGRSRPANALPSPMPWSGSRRSCASSA